MMNQNIYDAFYHDSSGLDMRVKELEKHKELDTQILQFSSNAIVIIDDGHIRFFNNKFPLLTGYSDDYLKDLLFIEIVYPQDEEVIFESYNEVLTNDASQTFTFRIFHRNGDIRWLQAKSHCLKYNDSREVLYFLVDITERKQAEEAVNTNLNFLNTLIDTIPTPLFYKNNKGFFIGCNSAFVEFMGKTKEEIIGKSIHDLTDRKMSENIARFNEELIRSQERQKYEVKIPHADGTDHDVIIYNTVFHMPDQTIGGMVGIIIDINDLKKAESALQESEKKYLQLLNEAPLGILSCDLNGNIQYINQILIDMLGSPSLDQSMKINMLTFPLLVKAGVSDQIQKCINTAQKCEFESSYSSQWGRQIYFHILLAPIKSVNGEMTGVLAILEDIEDRKKSEAALRESERRYRLLADNTLDMIWVKNLDLTNVYVSPSVKKVLGYTVDEYLNTTFEDVLCPKSCEVVKKIIQRYFEKIKNGETTDKNLKVTKELLYIRKDRTKVWAEVIISYHRDEENNIIGIHGITRDITERKRIIKKLRSAKKRAEESDNLKSAFVANMSHELRTPMNAILGFADLLVAEETTRQQKHEYITYIRNSGKSLLNLINEMLDTAKIEAGNIKIYNAECCVNQLFGELLAYFENVRKKENKENLSLRVSQGVSSHDFTIFADQFRLKQVLTNLIGNAIKFTDKGYIEFGYYFVSDDSTNSTFNINDSSLIQFYVRDTGIGIPPEKANLIFERFAQIEDSYRRNYGGAGLGLSITKNLVELMGGRIWLDSEIGEGTTFYFTLPYIELQTKINLEQKMENINVDTFDWKSKTILIAEDAEMNFVLLKKTLQKSQITVIWAKNGIEAVEMFQTNPEIDIILMDMQMPKLDGAEATKQIKALNPKIPIIAQTAFAMDGEEEKIIEIGCNDYISKPIDKDTLMNKIAALIK